MVAKEMVEVKCLKLKEVPVWPRKMVAYHKVDLLIPLIHSKKTWKMPYAYLKQEMLTKISWRKMKN
jgi:hypothetical protein